MKSHSAQSLPARKVLIQEGGDEEDREEGFSLGVLCVLAV
jgi:hypothetical protein